MWTVDPEISMGTWWALVTVGVVAIVWYACRREWSVSPVRRVWLTLLLALGLVGPLLIALNPTWVETIPPAPGNPMLSVLVDGTCSMKTDDMPGEPARSRWRRAVEIARQVDPMKTGIAVRLQAFADTIVVLPELDAGKTPAGNPEAGELPEGDATAWPQGHRTDLATALRQTTRTGSPMGHAILLISDGANNVGSVEGVLQAAREANAMATPIYTVTLGTSLGMKNIALTAKTPRMIAFPDNPVAIVARLGHSGLAGQSTQVTLYRGEQQLQTRTVRLGREANQEVRFVLEEGVQDEMERFRLVASEVPGEVTVADNQTTVLVQRLNAPIGVLMLEGKPYWDSKFLARNLGSNPVVDLTIIVRLGASRFLERKVASKTWGQPDPTDADEQPDAMTAEEDWKIHGDLVSPLESVELLNSYRLVILGRDADVFLTDKAIENVRAWISRGGGCLLCARGAPTELGVAKLSEILPIRWTPAMESRFRTQVTQYGIDSSVLDPLMPDGLDPLATLPSLSTGAFPSARAGLPQVLIQSAVDASGEVIPVVTYQSYGSGQTIVVEGAGMWRWAFLPPRHAEKDQIYPKLWQSMVQWIISQQDMMPGQEVAIRSDRAAFLSGDRVTASVVVREPEKFTDRNGLLELDVLLEAVDAELPVRRALAPSGMEDGLYRTDLGALDVGYYTVKAVRGEKDEVVAVTSFEVRDPWFESLEVDARPDLLRQVARLSGGTVLAPDDVADLVARFAKRMDNLQQTEEVRTTMWDKPWVLLLVLGGWISTWIVRRRSGLV